MLAGNVVALLSPMIFIPVLTLAFGRQKYDYQSMWQIRQVNESGGVSQAPADLELVPAEVNHGQTDEETASLNKASKIARILTVFTALCFLIFWPIPMYGSSYVFSKPFFRGWIVVGIIWLFFTAFGIIVFPVWEGRKTIAFTAKSIFLDLRGIRPATVSEARVPEQEIIVDSGPSGKNIEAKD